MTIPLDDASLDLIEHALGGALEHDEDAGEDRLVGADFSLHRLLDFWANHEPTTEPVGQAMWGGELVDVYDDTDSPAFHPNDLIAALIAEVRRLRSAT